MLKHIKMKTVFLKPILIYIIISFGFNISKAQQIPERYYEKIKTTALMSEIAYRQVPIKDLLNPDQYESPLINAKWTWGAPVIMPSGLSYTKFERTINSKREVVIAFRGTEPNRPNDIWTDIVQLFIPPQQYRDALEISEKYVKQKDGTNNMSLTFTGHSLGGGLAQLVSRYTGLTSYIFNSAGLTDLTENYTNNPYMGFFLDKIGVAKPIADYFLNRKEFQNLASFTTIHVKDEWDPVSPIGHQSGMQIVMKSPPETGLLDHHSQKTLIKGIINNHVKQISTGNSYNQQKLPTVTQISQADDIKWYDPNRTLFIGPKTDIQKLHTYNDNIQRYSMESHGSYKQDIPYTNMYNFKNIVYIKDFKNVTPNINGKYNYDNRFKELPRKKDDVYDDIKYTTVWKDPRYPPPAAIAPSNIGGVMLSNVAKVDSDEKSNTGRGNFSFMFNGNAPILDLDDYKKFCTSLWSVYFDATPPGISIDPISTDPDVTDVQMVRYIGNVINNDLGRVMRVADYTMKKWAVGTEKPNIAGFKDVDQLMASSHIDYFGASRRFWFVPEGMRFTAGDGYCVFTGGRMTLKTEYIFLDNKKTKAEPADIAFATFFHQQL